MCHAGVMSDRELIPLIVADVFELAGSFREFGDSIAGKVGQTQARWQVLSAASTGDKTVPQIARRLGYARQSVQRVADLLVADEIVQYVPNPDHQRSPLVRLSGKGERQLRKLTAAADHMHRQLARGFDPNELAVALRVLRKLRDSVTKTLLPVRGTAYRSTRRPEE